MVGSFWGGLKILTSWGNPLPLSVGGMPSPWLDYISWPCEGFCRCNQLTFQLTFKGDYPGWTWPNHVRALKRIWWSEEQEVRERREKKGREGWMRKGEKGEGRRRERSPGWSWRSKLACCVEGHVASTLVSRVVSRCWKLPHKELSSTLEPQLLSFEELNFDNNLRCSEVDISLAGPPAEGSPWQVDFRLEGAWAEGPANTSTLLIHRNCRTINL